MLLKNKGISFHDYKNMINEIEIDKKSGLDFFKNVYEVYSKECLEKNVMDFEDLLLNTFLLFKNDSLIREYYQNRFKYILIDEYQDTNHIQFEILKVLCWKSKKICGVGDDYQSIYSFRGADISNFSNLIEIFPNTKIYKLCQNYRSSPNIVNLASALINNNKNQMKKDLFSKKNEINEKINIIINENGLKEAENIGNIIKRLINENKCHYKDIAVLYRMNIQSCPFQKIFFKKNIPYKLTNRAGFFESKIIQNIFAYLKFIINPNLNHCLKRIINYPPRNIRKSLQNRLFSIANYNRVSCWEIINNCDNKEKIKQYKISNDLQIKLLSFKQIIIYMQSIINYKRVYGIVSELIECLGLKKYLENELYSLEKINLLLERINDMEEDYIKNKGLEKYTLEEFLKEIFENYDIKKKGKEDTVNLMTIHQAKGLEFEYVFIVGLEEGYFPCLHDNSDEAIEEERRILYVGMTRAKKNCYISYANNRIMGNEMIKRKVSRFIEEIDKKEFVIKYNPEFYQENQIYNNELLGNEDKDLFENIIKEIINYDNNKIQIKKMNDNKKYVEKEKNNISLEEKINYNKSDNEIKNWKKKKNINLIDKIGNKSNYQENENNNEDKIKFLNQKRLYDK